MYSWSSLKGEYNNISGKTQKQININNGDYCVCTQIICRQEQLMIRYNEIHAKIEANAQHELSNHFFPILTSESH